MITAVPPLRIIASCLFIIAIVASVIVLGRLDTAEEGSLGDAMNPDIDTLDAEADLGAYDALPDSGDSDPAPQPPPVEKPEDTLFAASDSLDAPRPATTNTRGNWHVNLASHTTPGIAHEMIDRIRAAGFDAALQRVDHDGLQWWRVYVRGFPSRQVATVQAEITAARLGLKAYWISNAS